jgi:hypothetical protein
MRQEIFDDLNGGESSSPFDPDMDASADGFEADVMGTPCPKFTMTTAPQYSLIFTTPLILFMTITFTCFLWEDYLTRVIAWKNVDMTWYMDDSRMGPGQKAWQWWYQVFWEWAGGLTDAFKHMFEMWWENLKGSVSMDKAYGDAVTSFFEHGVNPANLFRTDFIKFRQGVLFWRFILAAVFTMIRTIALINLPRNAIKSGEQYYGDPYDEAEAQDFDLE